MKVYIYRFGLFVFYIGKKHGRYVSFGNILATQTSFFKFFVCEKEETELFDLYLFVCTKNCLAEKRPETTSQISMYFKYIDMYMYHLPVVYCTCMLMGGGCICTFISETKGSIISICDC